ncbi:DEAD/DEAH box helicase family protein [Histomonas meleagridis]|uniref:DEAD/DEAH box helicase family protein n=1 Tax=Histomonas meleagridis TaxID=135588 RepID=UPI00355A9960|nr:DEAD/DEAH box helicase family protein [Histomonas meleagridis]KAH0804339.1 DEAD/DEAH box helicase family protein [Histomonas meleagridis]
MQSKAFDIIMNDDSNVLLCAPTGCGKTVIAELAFVRSMIQHEKHCLMLYVSPLRSLCQEKVRSWQPRFEKCGLVVQEYTGDSSVTFPSSLVTDTLLCTTPEKLDLATRSWNKKIEVFFNLSLLVVDEIHMLGDPRGAVLEAIISRILFISDRNNELYQNPPIRIVALSATVPNYEDVAQWLRVPFKNLEKTIFNDDVRETKLHVKVFGYNSASNDWMFENTLTPRVSSIIKQYSDNKPVIIFCCTRKSCEKTAAKLVADFHMKTNINESCVNDKKLAEYLKCGVGFHTAGLSNSDRTIVEQLFLRGTIKFICTTSTLAQGINLPAHLVIIKGTKHYNENELQEYNSSQILQMAGRAGRPQFHDEGICVIMTEKKNIKKYESVVNNTMSIESSLLNNLAEHLNAEIALNFINDQSDAITWLTSTYMYIRVQKNPLYYHLNDSSKVHEFLQQLCMKHLNLLYKNKFINMNQDGVIQPLQVGILCSQFGLMINTMIHFNKADKLESLSDVLTLLSSASEFLDFIVRQEEKHKLRVMSVNPLLRFGIHSSDDSNFFTPETKVFLLIDTILSQGKIDDWSLSQEFSRIKRTAERLLSCLFQLQIYKKSFIGTENTLILSKCITKQMWENNTTKQIQQIKKIGDVYSKKLQAGGFENINDLRTIQSYQIEKLTNHRFGWGIPIIEEIAQIPNYVISIQTDERPDELCINIRNLSEKDPTSPFHKAHILVGSDKDDQLIAYYPINHVVGHLHSTFRVEIPKGFTSSDIIVKCIDSEFLGIDIDSRNLNKDNDKYIQQTVKKQSSKPNVSGQQRIDVLLPELLANNSKDEIVWEMKPIEQSEDKTEIDSDFWDNLEFDDSDQI